LAQKNLLLHNNPLAALELVDWLPGEVEDGRLTMEQLVELAAGECDLLFRCIRTIAQSV
jgi:hypothetical protein